MNWFRENWFKFILLILIAWFVAVYSFEVYESHKPKNIKEMIDQEILNRIYK